MTECMEERIWARWLMNLQQSPCTFKKLWATRKCPREVGRSMLNFTLHFLSKSCSHNLHVDSDKPPPFFACCSTSSHKAFLSSEAELHAFVSSKQLVISVPPTPYHF